VDQGLRWMLSPRMWQIQRDFRRGPGFDQNPKKGPSSHQNSKSLELMDVNNRPKYNDNMI